MHSRVSLFSRKFWASKVMYRGSTADILVVLCKPGNPTANATEDNYTHFDNFLRLSPLRRVLEQGFRRSSAQNRGLGGDVTLKSG